MCSTMLILSSNGTSSEGLEFDCKGVEAFMDVRKVSGKLFSLAYHDRLSDAL